MTDLHLRAARVLGWSEAEVHSVSMNALRDLVRAKDPALASEMTRAIGAKEHYRQKRVKAEENRSRPTPLVDALFAGRLPPGTRRG